MAGTALGYTNTIDAVDNKLTRREQLADVITNTSPEETPCLSALSKSMRSTNDYCEWPEHSLARPTNTPVADGAKFGADSRTTPKRIGNYHQIDRKDISTTRRADVLRKAGRGRELTYQIMLAGQEMKRNMNLIIQGNEHQVARAGNPSDGTASNRPPFTASIAAYMYTNYDLGEKSGKTPTPTKYSDNTNRNGYPSAVGDDAADTAQDFSIGSFFTLKRQCFEEGGNPMHLFLMPLLKEKISAKLFKDAASRVATQRQDQGRTSRSSKGATVLGAVDVVLTDFGPVAIIADLEAQGAPLTASAASTFPRKDLGPMALLLDTRYIHMTYITRMETVNIGRVGDSHERMLLSDFAPVVRAQQTSAYIADLKINGNVAN